MAAWPCERHATRATATDARVGAYSGDAGKKTPLKWLLSLVSRINKLARSLLIRRCCTEHLLAGSLLSVGGAGLLGATIGCTGLASLLARASGRRTRETRAPARTSTMKLDLLIS